MRCFKYNTVINPEQASFSTLVLYISHYKTEPYDIAQLAQICSGSRNQSYLVFYYDTNVDEYEVLDFRVQGKAALTIGQRLKGKLLKQTELLAASDVMPDFFHTTVNVARSLHIREIKLCCHANLGEAGATRVVDNVNAFVQFFLPTAIYFIADNDACAEDARRYLLRNETHLGYKLPNHYIIGDYFLESLIPAALEHPQDFDAWIDNPACQKESDKKRNVFTVYVFDRDSIPAIKNMVSRIHTAAHEPSIIATYDANSQTYKVIQLEIRINSFRDSGENALSKRIHRPQEPLSLRHFSQFVRVIASDIHLRCDDGIRLCLPATLGNLSSSSITKPVDQLIRELNPSSVHLVQCSKKSKEDIKEYLKRNKTQLGYRLPECVLYGNYFVMSLIAQLEDNASQLKLSIILNQPYLLPVAVNTGCFSYLRSAIRSSCAFFGCLAPATIHITPSNRAFEAPAAEITPKNPSKISFSNSAHS